MDGNKKINGRKRHLVVDTLGNVVSNIVHPANIHDSKGADLTVRNLKESIHVLKSFTQTVDTEDN